ncbi:dihydrodipicolinate synthase family protein [Ramlibacter sp. AW1]|uniref:Dihydrodipicolinate synthase family protein n=1 Tax=Ramlibacter aurantiacus TaxID=2801330 RepID=A0A937D6C1_9BURK|nr:dihydrodipicolinate synthase family protein [Ramlibacter aurantiacus]MBL0422182.1 dihydrodipicolinate synthase family protein [Ramlibacter aurantiacus]
MNAGFSDRRGLSHRLYTALVLPLKDGYDIDEDGLRRLVRYYVQHRFAQVGGLIANPEAGEISYLTRDEKRRVLEIVLEEAAGKLPVLAGTFAWTTREVIQTAQDAKAIGAHGIFVIPPAGSMDVSVAWDAARYPEVWLDQIKDQDRAVDLPMFAHPISNMTPQWGLGLPLEPTLKICREVPNMVGWKMTYSPQGARLIGRALREHAPEVAILPSSAHFFHDYLASGWQFDGAISGSFNYAMESMLAHIEAFGRNDLVAAREVWNSGMARLHEYVYSEPGRLHVRYKIAAWLRGLIDSPLMRAPMPRPREEEIRALARLMSASGIEVVRKDLTSSAF